MSGHELDISSSFTQIGVSVSSNLSWKPHIYYIAKYSSQTLGFLTRARGFFSPSQLLTIFKSQIRSSLERCCHAWRGSPRSSLLLLDKIWSKAIRLINNPRQVSPVSLSSSGYRSVHFLSLFHGHCSLEIKTIIPDPLRHVRPTRSSTHSRPFQVMLSSPRTLSHKSSFISRTSQHWNTIS